MEYNDPSGSMEPDFPDDHSLCDFTAMLNGDFSPRLSQDFDDGYGYMNSEPATTYQAVDVAAASPGSSGNLVSDLQPRSLSISTSDSSGMFLPELPRHPSLHSQAVETTPGLATESVGSSSPLSAPPETPPHEGSEPKSTLKSSNSGKKLKRAPANNKGSQRGYLRKHRVSATKSTSKSGNKKKTGGRMVNASTNKQITPTEHSSLFVNPGSAVIDGPFTAYPRQMPVPVEPIDENLRNNPYLKNILMKPGNMEVEELLSRNSQGPTHESTTPVSAALCSQVSILTNPAPTYGSFMLPTIEELQELNAFLQSKFDSLVDEKNEAGIVLCGRERDKLFNRTARVPKLFIETRLKGIDGFKNECVAWDTAMNHRQILQRRDFFKDKMVEVERMMERVSKQQQNGLGGA